MKGEKGKLVLVYILMLLVIGLIVFLTFIVLNNGKEESNDSKANVTPTVDVNPYPNVSDVCTFELTTDEYNSILNQTSDWLTTNYYDTRMININNENYVKLRDIAKCINFGVDWDSNTKTVIIDSSKNYSA